MESRGLFDKAPNVFDLVADRSTALIDRVRQGVSKVGRDSASPDRNRPGHERPGGSGPPLSHSRETLATTQDTGPVPIGKTLEIGRLRVVVDRFLAEGAFAHVYAVRTFDSSEVYALKRISVPSYEADAVKSAEVELNLMKTLAGHRNIIRVYETSQTRRGDAIEYLVVMELATRGGLVQLMNTRINSRFAEREALKIFKDVCGGVYAMHNLNPPVAHRDLKVENVLLGDDGCFKLCDFGSATTVSYPSGVPRPEIPRLQELWDKTTTPAYRAPELCDLYQRMPVTERVDIWALGVFLFKVCFFVTPFEDPPGAPPNVLAILSARYQIPSSSTFSNRITDIIKSTLSVDPRHRPTIHEIISFIETGAPLPEPRIIKASSPHSSLAAEPHGRAYSGSPSTQTPVYPTNVVVPSGPSPTPMRRGRPTRRTENQVENGSPQNAFDGNKGGPIPSDDPFAAVLGPIPSMDAGFGSSNPFDAMANSSSISQNLTGENVGSTSMNSFDAFGSAPLVGTKAHPSNEALGPKEASTPFDVFGAQPVAAFDVFSQVTPVVNNLKSASGSLQNLSGSSSQKGSQRAPESQNDPFAFMDSVTSSSNPNLVGSYLTPGNQSPLHSISNLSLAGSILPLAPSPALGSPVATQSPSSSILVAGSPQVKPVAASIGGGPNPVAPVPKPRAVVKIGSGHNRSSSLQAPPRARPQHSKNTSLSGTIFADGSVDSVGSEGSLNSGSGSKRSLRQVKEHRAEERAEWVHKATSSNSLETNAYYGGRIVMEHWRIAANQGRNANSAGISNWLCDSLTRLPLSMEPISLLKALRLIHVVLRRGPRSIAPECAKGGAWAQALESWRSSHSHNNSEHSSLCVSYIDYINRRASLQSQYSELEGTFSTLQHRAETELGAVSVTKKPSFLSVHLLRDMADIAEQAANLGNKMLASSPNRGSVRFWIARGLARDAAYARSLARHVSRILSGGKEPEAMAAHRSWISRLDTAVSWIPVDLEPYLTIFLEMDDGQEGPPSAVCSIYIRFIQLLSIPADPVWVKAEGLRSLLGMVIDDDDDDEYDDEE